MRAYQPANDVVAESVGDRGSRYPGNLRIVQRRKVGLTIAQGLNPISKRMESLLGLTENLRTRWVSANEEQEFVKANQRISVAECPSLKLDECVRESGSFAPSKPALCLIDDREVRVDLVGNATRTLIELRES